MNAIKIINTVIIATILSCILVSILIVLFPICTLIEVIMFIEEAFGPKEYEHNIFAKCVIWAIYFIENSVNRMMED